MTELIDYQQFCGITPAVTDEEADVSGDDATVDELKKRIDASDGLFLLDVREPQEFQICRIPGSTLIPLGDLPSRLSELEGRGRHDRALQIWRSQWPKRSSCCAEARIRTGQEFEGWNPGLDRSDRPDASEVLRGTTLYSYWPSTRG